MLSACTRCNREFPTLIVRGWGVEDEDDVPGRGRFCDECLPIADAEGIAHHRAIQTKEDDKILAQAEAIEARRTQAANG